jgi:hypothetical protein
MATEKWTPGSLQSTWGACFAGADLNSLASASSVLSSLADIDNSSALDMFADISISLGSITPAAPNFVGVYLYPVNQDGTSYGDGLFTGGTQSTGVPSPSYFVGSIVLTTTAKVQVGMLERIVLPPGKFRWLVQNNAGVAFASSSNTISFRTYNRSIA